MYYIKHFSKDEVEEKKSLLYLFMMLEGEHRGKRGETRMISLHCKYDFDKERQNFYHKDIDIYMIIDEETERVNEFIEHNGFVKVDSMPKDIFHILGNYGVTIKAIDGFMV